MVTRFGTLDFTGVSAALRLFAQDQSSQITQAPKLVALDNQEATIFVGQTVRYAQTTASSNQSGGLTFSIGEAPNSPVQQGFQLLVIPHVRSGRLKAIAITGDARSPALPGVPTFKEAGLPGMDVKLWYGILAPAATPREIIDKLSNEIARILRMPEVKDNFLTMGADVFISTPSEVSQLIKRDLVRYAKLIKDANIRIE